MTVTGDILANMASVPSDTITDKRKGELKESSDKKCLNILVKISLQPVSGDVSSM